VRGWDFKIIVGRVLGWNILKSSRFEVSRAGSNFVFHGSGFGHGLGLCQEGAHVMAARGANSQKILEKYFPGTRVGRQTEAWKADLLLEEFGENVLAKIGEVAAARFLTISSEHFRITYPEDVDRRDANQALTTLEAARGDFVRRAAAASLSLNVPSLAIRFNQSTGDFTGRTGQPWWAAAATKGNRIELQPLNLLKNRGILIQTLRHELAHVFIDAIAGVRSPRWLEEGFALYLAGEGQTISRYAGRDNLSGDQLEKQLQHPRSQQEMRELYARAYLNVAEMVHNQGEASVWRKLSGR
jgi:stage II sporulation protein D